MSESTPLEILLVEDNPGDARLIQEMLDEFEPAPGRLEEEPLAEGGAHEYAVTPLSAVQSGRTSLTHVTRLSEGLERLSEAGDEPPDVVLLDLNLPDSAGLETLQRIREHADPIPIVVLTGLQDRQFGVRALNHGAHEYLVKGEINSDLLIRSVYHAIERAAYETRLARQHERLETLNKLNALVQDVTQAMIGLATREEIEQTVCDQLAASDLYTAAWIGDVAPDREEVSLRASAGGVEEVEDVDRLTALSGPAALGAVRSRELQLAYRTDENDEPDGWGETLAMLDSRSAAAVPISYEQSLYGVLLVYSARPDAFDSREHVVASRLGEVVGHTVNAVETKRRLLADTVVEIQFESTDRQLFFAAASADLGCTFRLDRVVPADGDDLLYYVSVEGAATDEVLDAVDGMPSVERARHISGGNGGGHVFEFKMTGPSVPLTLMKRGTKVASAVAEEGTVRFTAEVPPQADVRSIVDAITEAHPTVGFVARREVDRSRPSQEESLGAIEETLTERQRSALHAAYHSGFFEWPRGSTGEEVAASLGISAPTYHEHLRHAQQKVMTHLLEADGEKRDRSTN